MQEYISAIDIGTTKICALTANVTHDSLGNLALRVLGYGQATSQGIRRGVVVNVSEAIACIGEAVEKCEHDAGQHMISAYVGIAGSHIGTLNSQGVSPVDRRNGVTGQDMQRALEGARAVALPQNQEVIHTIAREWTVDGQSEVQHPLGMSAYRLEVDAHIVTGSTTAIKNLAQCVLAHNIDIDELVLEPLAANEAVLRPEERRMGVAVVDMGGGTTDIAVFLDDGLCHTVILDMGGNHSRNDVAVGFTHPLRLPKNSNCATATSCPNRVPKMTKCGRPSLARSAERSFSRRFICEILEARAVEMFEIIRAKLADSGYLDNCPRHRPHRRFQPIARHDRTWDAPFSACRCASAHRQPSPAYRSRAHCKAPPMPPASGCYSGGCTRTPGSAHRRFAAGQDNRRDKWMGKAVRMLRHLLPD